MAVKVGVDVDADAFKKAFGALAKDLQGTAVEMSLRASALILEEAIKNKLKESGRHAPGTKTPSAPGSPPAQIVGELRDSVRVFGPKRKGFGVYEAMVGPVKAYARIQDLGGGHLPARPYMMPAVEDARTQMYEAFMWTMRRYVS